jgi:hypothetical protein
MKILVPIICLFFLQNTLAQKLKNYAYSITPSIALPYKNIARFNTFGYGIQITHENWINKIKTTKINLSVAANKFLDNSKIFYTGENLQEVRIIDITVGVQTKLYHNLYVGLNVGFGFASKHLTDAPRFLFIMIKPTLCYELNKKIALKTTLSIGNAKEDSYIFQSFGIGYTF